MTAAKVIEPEVIEPEVAYVRNPRGAVHSVDPSRVAVLVAQGYELATAAEYAA